MISVTLDALALDRFDLAERLCEQALDLARERGSAYRFALASDFRALTRLYEGDLQAAEADGRAALDSEGLEGIMYYQPVIVLVGSLADQGRTEEGERLLADWRLDGAIGPSRPLTALLIERGRLRVAAGDAETGLADLEEARQRLARVGVREGAVGLDAWLEQASALYALGRADEARDEAERALEAARGWETNGAVGGALRVSGLLRGGEEGVSLLGEAVERLALSPRRLWHARALVDFGAALRRAGQRSRAREPLREGLELADRCGAMPLAETARRELAATGVKVPRRGADRDALTASERRIAELAIQGASNPEIAQQLFVTVKTVEGHLSHAFRKLGIRSRRELATALANRSA